MLHGSTRMLIDVTVVHPLAKSHISSSNPNKKSKSKPEPLSKTPTRPLKTHSNITSLSSPDGIAQQTNPCTNGNNPTPSASKAASDKTKRYADLTQHQ